VSLPEGVVGHIVGRGDFDGARAKGWVDEVGIGYNGEREAGNEWMANEFVVQILQGQFVHE